MNTIRKIRASHWFAATAIASLSPLLLMPPMAQAQTASSGGSGSVGSVAEVVVTARKRTENVQKVPVSVTAVTGNQLKQQSIKTVSNLQNVAPGLIIQQGLDDPQSIVVTMRGRKQDDATMAVDASTSLSVDGLNIPRTLGMGGSMIDISRVEVLRGPQGTLYGRNSTGGAIGIYTNDPSGELSGSIDVTGGDYGTYNLIAIANVPITDNLAARFVAERGGNGGYDHTTTGVPLNNSASEYYRAKLKWTGSNNWQIVLSGHYEHETSGQPRGYVPELDPANFQGSGLPVGGYLTLQTEYDLGVSQAQAIALEQAWTAKKSPWYTLDNNPGAPVVSDIYRGDVGLNISGNLTDYLQFRSITGIQRLARDESGQAAGPIFIYNQHPESTGTYYSQEFQLLGTTPTLSWVVGAYGGYETGTDDQTVFSLDAPTAFGTNGTANINGILNTTLAGYAQATWEFVPRWHLTAGVRYTSDTRQIDANAYLVDFYDTSLHECLVPAAGLQTVDMTSPATIGATSQCPRTFRAAFSEPTWLISLDHQITPNVLFYAKVATGYRSGGLNADSGSIDLSTFEAFAPESNIEYEAGVKSTFFDRRLRLNVDGYWDNYTNLQVLETIIAADGSFQSVETSAAQARIRGIEAEGDVIVTKGLSLHASLAYTDPRYIHYVDATGDHSNEPFSVPKWTYTLNANYKHPTGVGEASLEVDYAWKSAVDVNPASTLASSVTQPGYGLLNARLNLHLDAWNMDIAVFSQNLTDVSYFDQGFGFQAPGLDFNEVLVGPPRTFGVELVKKFGG